MNLDGLLSVFYTTIRQYKRYKNLGSMSGVYVNIIYDFLAPLDGIGQ